MPETMVHVTALVTTTCWCGVAHAIPTSLMRMAQEDGTAVWCPLGHEWVVSGKTAAQELKEANVRIEAERRRTQATRDLLHAEERSHSATRGHLTRQRKRVSAGVCPVQGCQRHFKDLERHMKSKHPDLGGL